jgi:hypothetical protein
MCVRLAAALVVTLGLAGNIFASGSSPLRHEVSKLAQMDGSRKCPTGSFWACTKYGCWCQQNGTVY